MPEKKTLQIHFHPDDEASVLAMLDHENGDEQAEFELRPNVDCQRGKIYLLNTTNIWTVGGDGA